MLGEPRTPAGVVVAMDFLYLRGDRGCTGGRFVPGQCEAGPQGARQSSKLALRRAMSQESWPTSSSDQSLRR